MSYKHFLTGVVLFLVPGAASAQFVGEQVTPVNAATLLFGGTDADGGIGDWYVSNGVVEAIIDDVGVQADLVGLLGPQAPRKQSEAAFTGGSVVDLGRVGANNDQLAQQFSVGGLSTSNFLLYDTIGASVGTASATVTVSGTLLGFNVPPANLPVTTEFTASGSDPFLSVTTTVTNTDPSITASGLGGFLDVFIWVTRGIVPFSPLPNRGFTHFELNLSNPGPSLELPSFSAGPGMVFPTDGMIDPNTGNPAGEVSYGLLGETVSLDPDGPGGASPTVSTVNTLFGVSGNLISAFGNLPTGNLPPGGILSYTRRLYVGTRNDVASVSNDMIPRLATRQGFATGTISGDVNATDTPNVAASGIATKTGGPATPGFATNAVVTHFRTDATGGFSGVVLPIGTYDIELRAPERDAVVVSGVNVAAATNSPVTVPPMTGLGTLELTVLERGLGPPQPPIPSKVTIRGLGTTPNPIFRRDFDAFVLHPSGPPTDLQPETFGGGPAQGNVVYLADGTEAVQLRPGLYEVFASRGLEYTVKRRKVRIKEGKTKRRTLRIKHVVDTAEFMSGDFHIHSARSLDTSAALRDRVASFAGEGVDVMVSTDHDFHLDYAPVIASMGLGAHITSIVGNEVTSSVPNPPAFPDGTGHINAWPLPVDPDEARDGSIQDEFIAPNIIYSRLRDQGAQVIQYNHPRAGVSGLTSIGFFNNFGYDPDLPITASPNDLLLDDDILGPGISGVSNPDGFRNIDFDVMEVGNGISINGYLASRRDWFSLLNQTDFSTVPFIAGSGVSDSHRITVESAGYMRAYVGRVGDDPQALDVTAFNNNIRAGNMMSTTGPYIEFSAEESGGSRVGMGETLEPSSSNVTLHVRVQATNWIPVEEVRIYANGFLSMTFDGTTSPAVSPAPNNPRSQSRGRVVRFDAEIPIVVSADTWFVVEAGAKLSPVPTPPPFAAMIVPDYIAIGFTNPIFVDLAGDGFDPPGLPVMASLSGRGETVPAFARVERRYDSMWARADAWWKRTLASVRNRGIAEAGHDVPPFTGKELQAEVERSKSIATDDYFPLYRFEIPADAVDQAVDQLPEPERSRVLEQRRRNAR